jgi:predicted Zn-dependent peptidase
VVFFLFTLKTPLPGQDLEGLVVEHTLQNGMQVLIVERPQVPLVSFNISYRVGGVNEHAGITGIAHLYEHMAFKGTQTIGTTHYRKEKKVLGEMDRVLEEIKREEALGERGEIQRLKGLKSRFEELQKQADEFVVPNEFSTLYERQGGVGFNAGTGQEFTRYVVSLPSNRVPFWIAMEQERMSYPVLREFYKERDVVMEERRRSYEANPMGKLYEAFLATAFIAHPYRLPVIGWSSDIAQLTRPETQSFFETYYGPNNAVVAIVGDVNAKALIKTLEKTFGKIKTRSFIPPVETQEPPQEGERRVEIVFDANPAVMVGYHKPGIHHPDEVVFDVIDSLLSNGRTSRFYKKIVQEKQLAVSVSTSTGVPGARFTNLFMIDAIPRSPHTTQEVENAIYEELVRLGEEPVGQRDLQKILNQLDASLIRSLQSNSGMASQLAYFETIAGSWRYILKAREDIGKVTPEDIMRVAKTYFTKENRTVATLVKKNIPTNKEFKEEDRGS